MEPILKNSILTSEDFQGRLETAIHQSPMLKKLFERSPDLNLPNWYIGSGCITQTIWNEMHGFPPLKSIKDIDWIYFDSSDLTANAEDVARQKVQKHFSDLPLPIDVTNEARVHCWYEDKFGFPIEPYKSSEEAIDSWPSPSHAVGVSNIGGELKVYAPYGLDDLFNMIIRPNKALINEEIFLKKASRWHECWPKTKVIPWDQS